MNATAPPATTDDGFAVTVTFGNSGSLDAATNRPPAKAVPNGEYGLIGDASSAPVRPLNTFTWADTPAPAAVIRSW